MSAGRLIRGLAKGSAKRVVKKATAHKNKLLEAERKKSRVTKPLLKSTRKVEAGIKKMAVKGKTLRSKAASAAKRRLKK